MSLSSDLGKVSWIGSYQHIYLAFINKAQAEETLDYLTLNVIELS